MLEAQKIAPKARSCPKVADHNRDRPIYPQASIPESGFTYMRRSLNLPLLVEIDALYFKRDKCAKNNKQTNKQAKQQQQQQQQKHSGLSVADPDHPGPEGGAVIQTLR